MSDERGTALIEMLVLGFAVVLIVLPVLVTVARIIDANAVVSSAARDSATWLARHGTIRPVTGEGVAVETSATSDIAHATARATVTLVAVGGMKIERQVVASYDAPVSPYRSDR